MPNLELRRLAGSTFVVEGPTNVGVYALSAEVSEGQSPGRLAVLIDSGNDDDYGRKILRALGNEGLALTCIANTHSNADHCGGNAFLQSRTGCKVAAPRLEASFIEHPELESALLWGGFPVPPLRNKFLVAKGSRVTDYLEAPCEIPGSPVRALPLPGHYLGQVGYLTPDRVLFAADAAASPKF